MKIKPAEREFFDSALVAAMQGMFGNPKMVDDWAEFKHIPEDAANVCKIYALALIAKRREILEESK